VVISNKGEPATQSDQPLETLSSDQLVTILQENLGNRVKVIIRDRMSQVDPSIFTAVPVTDALAGSTLPEGLDQETINDLSSEQIAFILSSNLDNGLLVDLINEQIVQPTVIESWQLIPSIFNRQQIEEEAATNYPEGRLEFKSWVNADFLTSSASSRVSTTGLR